MLLLRVLLSAVTLFGGHVLNGRLDRVLQVFALLAIVGGVCFLAPTLLFSVSRTELLPDTLKLAPALPLIIAVVSAVLTWKDARTSPVPPLSLTTRVAGGTVSVFGLIVIALATMMLVVTTGGTYSSGNSIGNYSPSHLIYASTRLGGNIRYDELKRPPAGTHPLRGRIVMAGRPVASAEVEVILNEAFRAESLTTNARGEFEILLPAGPWTLNEVTVTRWPDAPEGANLLLLSEYEPLEDSGYYSRVHDNVGALRIELPTAANFEYPTFELREPIAMQWPADSEFMPSGPSEAPKADLATATIRWEKVPGAAEYEIHLDSVERLPKTLKKHLIQRRRQSDTQLRLADLPKQNEPATAREYSVSVIAFDARGKMLSQSRGGSKHYAFILDGETQLADEPVHRSSPEDAEQLRDMERLSLVSGLLEYKQLDAARAILKEVSDNAPPGQKAAMQGAIEALAGNCAAAIPLLDQAEKEGGLGCAPGKYRAMCPANAP